MRMKKGIKRILALFACLTVLAGSGNIHKVQAEGETVRILFTSDLNDHILNSGSVIASVDAEGKVTRETVAAGGYAFLAKVIANNRTDNSVLVDAGNFSNGQGFDFLNTEKAPDLTLLGLMGYDACTLGRQEFLSGVQAMTYMLRAAEKTPQIVMANITAEETEAGQLYGAAVNDGLISSYTIVEKGGIKIGIFGIMDEAEGQTLRSDGNVSVGDAEHAARETVEALKKEGAQVIICLDHGADPASQIASKVSGIDVLVCSNHYAKTEEPVKAGDTLVVSAGFNGWYLGVLDIDVNTKEAVSYKLDPVTKDSGYIPAVSNKAVEYWNNMNDDYLKGSGYGNASVVAVNAIKFQDIRENYTEFGNNNTADIITDSYVRALNYVSDNYSFAIGITDKANVGDALPEGNITIREIMETIASGRGYDGDPGVSLLQVYMTGKDLRALCEYDVSIARDNYPDEQMYFSGMKYVYSDKRSDLNKVEEVYAQEAKGYWVPVTNSKYYRVVLNREIAERKDLIKERSDGYLDVNFYYANHAPITQFETAVLQVDQKECKPWVGMVMELEEAYRTDSGQPFIISAYRYARDCKKEDVDPELWDRFKNPSDRAIETYKNWCIGIIAAWAAWKTAAFIWNRYKLKKSV